MKRIKIKIEISRIKSLLFSFFCFLLIVSLILPTTVSATANSVAGAGVVAGVAGGLDFLMNGADAVAASTATAIPNGKPVMDKSNTAVNLAGVIRKVVKFVAQTAYANFRKQLLDTMVDQIVKYIQGGGDPKFVTDFGSFLTEAADEAGGHMLEELVGSKMLNQLCHPSWGVKVMNSLSKPATFATKAKCSISTLVGNQTTAYNDFMSDFKKGGWKTWLQVTEPQNNLNGFYLLALDEKISREEAAKKGAELEGSINGGFLSDKRCHHAKNVDTGEPKDYANGVKKADIPPGFVCTEWRTRTPGKIVSEGLVKGAFKDIDWLITNEEAASYVVAITDALVNRLFAEGLTMIQTVDVEGGGPNYQSYGSNGNPIGQPSLSNFFDEDGPTTELSVYDPWRVQLRASADSDDPDQDVTIRFTIDGSDPKVSGSVIISPSPTQPLAITKPTVIRWFGTDKSLNEETTINEVLIKPLLAGPYVNAQSVQTPFTVAMAIDSNHIALVSDKPANIYYTTDGQTPALDSANLYYQIIEVPSDHSITLKWFGWLSSSSGDSYQEPMHTLDVRAPLPSVMFGNLSNIDPLPGTDITDGGKWPPTAKMYVSSQAPIDTFFTLNPSLSSAYAPGDTIVSYEWDLDDDGEYDWIVEDSDADGIFETPHCTQSSLVPAPQVCGSLDNIGTGFSGMTIPQGGDPGEISVKYVSPGEKTITLRVVDSNGLGDTKTRKVYVTF